jgi:hypothetical protein
MGVLLLMVVVLVVLVVAVMVGLVVAVLVGLTVAVLVGLVVAVVVGGSVGGVGVGIGIGRVVVAMLGLLSLLSWLHIDLVLFRWPGPANDPRGNTMTKTTTRRKR